MAKLLIISIIFQFSLGFCKTSESKQDEFGSIFSGRISKLNPTAKIMRIRTDFGNIKFLNRQDRVEFWNESYPDQRCMSFVQGRANDYLLVKIPQYESCIRKIHFTTGAYLHFQSPELKETVKLVQELVEILLKKRIAMQAKKERHHKELTGHVEKVDSVNKRFEILRQKLEIEWQKELSLLEEDKARSFTEYKNSEARLNEIDLKLEAYRIEDHNLKLDRWSLDPAFYIKK
jgi:hypothetical protein